MCIWGTSIGHDKCNWCDVTENGLFQSHEGAISFRKQCLNDLSWSSKAPCVELPLTHCCAVSPALCIFDRPLTHLTVFFRRWFLFGKWRQALHEELKFTTIHMQVVHRPCQYRVCRIKARNQRASLREISVHHVGRANDAASPSSFAQWLYFLVHFSTHNINKLSKMEQHSQISLSSKIRLLLHHFNWHTWHFLTCFHQSIFQGLLICL